MTTLGDWFEKVTDTAGRYGAEYIDKYLSEQTGIPSASQTAAAPAPVTQTPPGPAVTGDSTGKSTQTTTATVGPDLQRWFTIAAMGVGGVLLTVLVLRAIK